MSKMIHSMIRVLDEERSVNFYSKAFGLKVAERFEFDSFVLVYLRNEETDFELELTINKGRSEPYALGEGYGHLAISVDDLDAAHKRLTDAGLNPNPLSGLQHESGFKARFFFITDPDGYKIEVLQRGGRFK